MISLLKLFSFKTSQDDLVIWNHCKDESTGTHQLVNVISRHLSVTRSSDQIRRRINELRCYSKKITTPTTVSFSLDTNLLASKGKRHDNSHTRTAIYQQRVDKYKSFGFEERSSLIMDVTKTNTSNREAMNTLFSLASEEQLNQLITLQPNLVAFIRLNLFVKVDLQKWLDKPFHDHPPPKQKYVQGDLFFK